VIDVKYYRAVFAHQSAVKKRHASRCNRKLDNNKTLRKIVLFHLKKFWSPEQIAKRLKVLYPDDMNMHISHETIYSYIYILPKGKLKNKLISCLRRNHKYRRRKGSNRARCGPIQDYLSIEERPKEVADRVIGALGRRSDHW
jgi:IS30 family transposase